VRAKKGFVGGERLDLRREAGVGFSKGIDVIRPGFVGADDVSTF